MKSSKPPPASKVEVNQTATYQSRRKSLLNTLMALVAILALPASSARAQTLTNWLSNPGFELGTSKWINMPPWLWNGASWAAQNTNLFVNGSTTVKVSVHGGTNAFKIWGYFQPYTTTPGAMQTFPAAPGSQWTADGWASTQSPDNMTSTETSYIEVQFLDATTNIIAGADNTSATMTTASTVSTWLHFQVVDSLANTTLTAPAGTAFVRFLVRFTQPTGYPAGSCYWDDVTLIRTSKPDPEITAQPVPVTRVYGQTATFSVAADGQTALSYKWQNGGGDITDSNAYGVTTSTLTLSNVTTATIGNYTVTVTDAAGSLTSDTAFLNVLDPGVISITPALGQTKTNGGTATITVAAAGSSTLTYGWQLNGIPLSNNGRVTGVTTPTLNVANLTAADAGNYTVLIDGGADQASSGLKVVPASQLATNLLINPGFEDGVFSEPWEAAWIKFNGAVLATSNDFYNASTTHVSVYDGNYVCRTYASDPDNGLYQSVPATASATYHVGGRFYMSSLDPVVSPAWVVLQFMFKDAGGNTITTFAAPQINPSFGADTWTSLQVTNANGSADLVAPAATVSAICQVYEYAQIGGGGSVYSDDLYATLAQPAVPPLPPSFSITPSLASGQINISFPTTNGAIYEVLYSGNVADPLSTWRTNATVIGDGTVKSVPDTLSAAARFYRVRAHNP